MTERTDLRRSVRRGVSLPVSVFDGTATWPAIVRNLSVGGAFLALEPPLPLGTGVSLRIPLGDGAKLGLRGHVRWTRSLPGPGGEPVGIGVEWFEPDADTVAALVAWVQRG